MIRNQTRAGVVVHVSVKDAIGRLPKSFICSTVFRVSRSFSSLLVFYSVLGLFHGRYLVVYLFFIYLKSVCYSVENLN